ncbi:MAG: biotin transporter BioY [Clostridia bacterium]|nr:biotin transporter BioY [Clostridia bacterium]
MRTALRPDVKTLIRAALCAALIVVCSWISIPWMVPFTMQTFAVFFACEVMGGAAIWPVLLYLLLGAIGLPVFSGMKGGLGVMLGPTGGYMIGFIGIALLMSGWKRLLKGKLVTVGMALGLLLCYLIGTVWFVEVYSRGAQAVSYATALSWCVLPFIGPDLVKLALARLVGNRVKLALKGEHA